MQGEGTFTWADGDMYVGTWRNNQRDGKGKMVKRSGDEEMLVYENGVKQE